LYRSRSERAIAGIAGGMAEYLEVDPTVVRILWILAGIVTGGAILILYIILAFVIPLNPFQGGPMPAGAGYAGPGYPGTTPGARYAASGATAGGQGWGQPGTGQGAAYAAPGAAPAWSPDWSSQWDAQRTTRAERPGRAGLIIGTVLIVIGVVALADMAIPGWVGGALLGPAILLAIGAALLVASVRRGEDARAAAAPAVAGQGVAAEGFSTPSPAPVDAATDVSAAGAPDPAPTPATAEAGATTGWDEDATSSFPVNPEPDRS
ncbi:MAG TPA: PspC domain-containing protein, partial [Candidatus Limnocylindrales bacterium]|nr:PspC domain-containing protein [Candidatus Limnocylindrales bacterium]